MNQKPIILMTTLYPSILDDSHRLWEFKKCLEINLENKNITEIVIFFERKSKKFNPLENGFDFLKNKKIKLYYLTNNPSIRPTFKDFFEYANFYYPKHHIIVCNSDIFFYKDSNIERLLELDKHNEIWILTRYSFVNKWKKWVIAPFGRFKNQSSLEDIPDFKNWETVTSLEEYNTLSKELNNNHICNQKDILSFCTADSFCFYAPIIKTNFDIFLGTPYCENYLRLKANLSKIKILNPAFSIVSRHLHHHGERNHSSINYFKKKDYFKVDFIPTTKCTLENKKYDIFNKYKFYTGVFTVLYIEKYLPFLYKICEKIYHKFKYNYLTK